MSYFITLYTDASFRPDSNLAKVAWTGKCLDGTVSSSKVIYSEDTVEAEMRAVLEAIKDCLKFYPKLEGFFVNSDNMATVEAFWTFQKDKLNPKYHRVRNEINDELNGRWIRTKHVKAHTGKKDVRSYLNRRVDKMTKGKIDG